MKTLPNPLIGLCFLQRDNALFDVRQFIHKIPTHVDATAPRTYNYNPSTNTSADRNYLHPQPGETFAISSEMPYLIDYNATGNVTPSSHMKDHESIFITSSLSTVNINAAVYKVINFSNMPQTFPTDTLMVDFKVLTPEQVKKIKSIDPSTFCFTLHQHGKQKCVTPPTDEKQLTII